jgi:hypothetical protein
VNSVSSMVCLTGARSQQLQALRAQLKSLLDHRQVILEAEPLQYQHAVDKGHERKPSRKRT